MTQRARRKKGMRYCVRGFLASKVQYWYKGKCEGEQNVSASGVLYVPLSIKYRAIFSRHPRRPSAQSQDSEQANPAVRRGGTNVYESAASFLRGSQFRKLGQSLPPSTRALNTRFASHAAQPPPRQRTLCFSTTEPLTRRRQALSPRWVHLNAPASGTPTEYTTRPHPHQHPRNLADTRRPIMPRADTDLWHRQQA
ncbi:hypothetical protein K438DRAFT_1777405 [Mycena galopus ATCC 62051]|nr:hypothetical protein K438DRAFT_1777405 [Mycena galopus ATCC 62051]